MEEIEWRDVVNLLGFFITIASLWLAFWQLRKSTSAAEAARAAAERMLLQNRDQFRQYVAANLRRYLSELEIFVDGESWDGAILRLNDIAEQLSQLALIADADDRTAAPLNSDIAAVARDWANTCRRIKIQKARFVRTKFGDFLRRAHGTIDLVCGPFANAKEVSR